MISIRRSDERGHRDYGWLNTSHTFSFNDYHDPKQMGFRQLRVINDDRVAPGKGFGTHPHRDMEIITYVLSGALEHKDSMGTGSVILPGEVQRMTAGTGVTHSEANPSPTEPVHFLQVWIQPEAARLKPEYEQKSFPEAERRGKLRRVAARDGAEGAVRIHQDVTLYAGLLDGVETARLPLAPGRHAWVQVARGTVRVNGNALTQGDGAALSDEAAVELSNGRDAEVLVFDLA
jgi:quercetin 2,3-dioxygenase